MATCFARSSGLVKPMETNDSLPAAAEPAPKFPCALIFHMGSSRFAAIGKSSGARKSKRGISAAARNSRCVYESLAPLGPVYKKGTASLGRAAEIAGVPVGEMIALFAEYGVKSNLRKEDYFQGLANLEKVW